MSNLLAIPLIKIVVNTGNNEDWIDPILFLVSDTVPDTTPENRARYSRHQISDGGAARPAFARGGHDGFD